MKKAIVCLLIAFIAVLGSQQAKAYYLELVPGDINGQSIFYLDIVFNADPEGNTLGDYGFDLFYDNTELTGNQRINAFIRRWSCRNNRLHNAGYYSI